MPPFLGGGSMIRRVRMDGFEPADLPAKFEAGTPPIVPAIGLGAAIDYLLEVGFENILEYERVLTRHAHHVLGEVAGVRILGPFARAEVGYRLFCHGRHPRARHRPALGPSGHRHSRWAPLRDATAQAIGFNSTSRASFYFYNTLDEIDQLAAGLQETRRVFRRG